MALKKFDKIKSFDDVNKVVQDIRDNLSIQDLKASDVRVEAPTEETLDKTRYTIAEESGSPVIYYRATNGTLYKLPMTAA